MDVEYIHAYCKLRDSGTAPYSGKQIAVVHLHVQLLSILSNPDTGNLTRAFWASLVRSVPI